MGILGVSAVMVVVVVVCVCVCVCVCGYPWLCSRSHCVRVCLYARVCVFTYIYTNIHVCVCDDVEWH